ncbi:MAG TPA: efflux RND transporter periplasmic adaptor subunit, partial [Chromatiales bacterium]|nr:efflux RND transporter periplasmic adaptor subunit [Chromatiales bacterium]
TGQSLFTIDPAPYAAALEQARADVASARAKLDKAKRNTVRFKQLYEKNTISQQDYDDAVSNETIAEAELKAAQARLTQAGLDLEYTRVESPIAGIAGRALRSEGNYVTGPEVLLTTVTQSDPIYVLFGIADEERRRLDREAAAGQLVLPQDGAFDVTVKLAEGSEYTQTGKLTFSDVRISGTTGTSEARAELPNPNGYLRPGQFVRVILKGAFRPGAILVPQRAVRDGPAGKFVYVVDAQNTAQARPVTLGDWQGDEWIITSGLAAGDKVIVDGVMKIGPGAPVSIAAPAGADAPAQDAAISTTATRH